MQRNRVDECKCRDACILYCVIWCCGGRVAWWAWVNGQIGVESWNGGAESKIYSLGGGEKAEGACK